MDRTLRALRREQHARWLRRQQEEQAPLERFFAAVLARLPEADSIDYAKDWDYWCCSAADQVTEAWPGTPPKDQVLAFLAEAGPLNRTGLRRRWKRRN
jgi:aspartate aminotransferase-like enzyme